MSAGDIRETPMDEPTNLLDGAFPVAAVGLGAGRYEPEILGTTFQRLFEGLRAQPANG